MIFLDISTEFGTTTTPILVSDMGAIKNKMLNLFKCPIGSRFKQQEFGTKLNQFVHQPVDSITTSEILNDLLTALARWMKDEVVVDMAASYVVPRPGKDGYYVKISYSVPRLRAQGALNFSAMRD